MFWDTKIKVETLWKRSFILQEENAKLKQQVARLEYDNKYRYGENLLFSGRKKISIQAAIELILDHLKVDLTHHSEKVTLEKKRKEN